MGWSGLGDARAGDGRTRDARGAGGWGVSSRGGGRGHPQGQGTPVSRSGLVAVPSLKMAAAPTRRALTADGGASALPNPILPRALTQDGGSLAGVAAGRGGRKRR